MRGGSGVRVCLAVPSGVAGLGDCICGVVACIISGWSHSGCIRGACGTSLAGILVGAMGCHHPLPAHICLPHFVTFILTFVAIIVVFFFIALVVLLVVTMVVGLTFALLVVAVAVAAALIVLVALILAAVFTLLFGSAWGYVRLALACAC